MKKIVFVIESLQHGGAEKSLVTLLRNIDNSEYKIDLLLFNKGGNFEKFLPDTVNILYRSNINKNNRIRLLLSKTKFWINKRHNKYHTAQTFWKSYADIVPGVDRMYDIAIAYNQGFATYFVAEKVQATKKYAWVNTDYQKAGYKASFDIPYYHKFSKIIAVSPEAKKSLEKAFQPKSFQPEIEIIKDISDSKHIEEQAKEAMPDSVFKDNKTNILSVGRLAKPKAFHLAIQACKWLVDSGYSVNWYIIGEGNERKHLEKLIIDNNMEEHFHLLGYRENPYPYIKNCDIYVQTSKFEGLGLTLIEASILQKPIVSTNFPTASEIITHNKTGLVCEMTSLAIATAVKELIINPELATKFKDNLKSIKNKDKELSLKKINLLLSGILSLRE